MLTKYLIGIIAVLAFGGGTLFGSKALTKKCPDCNPVLSCPECPECPATVSLNTFDFDKIHLDAGIEDLMVALLRPLGQLFVHIFTLI